MASWEYVEAIAFPWRLDSIVQIVDKNAGSKYAHKTPLKIMTGIVPTIFNVWSIGKVQYNKNHKPHIPALEENNKLFPQRAVMITFQIA